MGAFICSHGFAEKGFGCGSHTAQLAFDVVGIGVEARMRSPNEWWPGRY